MKISREAHSSRRRQRPSYPKNRLKQINAKLLIKMKIDCDMDHESRLFKIIFRKDCIFRNDFFFLSLSLCLFLPRSLSLTHTHLQSVSNTLRLQILRHTFNTLDQHLQQRVTHPLPSPFLLSPT